MYMMQRGLCAVLVYGIFSDYAALADLSPSAQHLEGGPYVD
jgi:hypothetical protein